MWPLGSLCNILSIIMSSSGKSFSVLRKSIHSAVILEFRQIVFHIVVIGICLLIGISLITMKTSPPYYISVFFCKCSCCCSQSVGWLWMVESMLVSVRHTMLLSYFCCFAFRWHKVFAKNIYINVDSRSDVFRLYHLLLDAYILAPVDPAEYVLLAIGGVHSLQKLTSGTLVCRLWFYWFCWTCDSSLGADCLDRFSVVLNAFSTNYVTSSMVLVSFHSFMPWRISLLYGFMHGFV